MNADVFVNKNIYYWNTKSCYKLVNYLVVVQMNYYLDLSIIYSYCKVINCSKHQFKMYLALQVQVNNAFYHCALHNTRANKYRISTVLSEYQISTKYLSKSSIRCRPNTYVHIWCLISYLGTIKMLDSWKFWCIV